MLQLSDHLKAHLPPGKEFDAILQLRGEVFREHKNRRTIRTELGGRTYFLKTHGPTGMKELFKNASRGRWPVLTAAPEWRAIKRLEALGVPTIHAVGYGCRGRFPHRLESFILTEALHDMIHLSDVPQALSSLEHPERAAITRRLITEVARISRALHEHGLNHRDYYLGHFMVRRRDEVSGCSTTNLTPHLIDLHRVQIRSRTPRRWAIKDISGLLFSALDAGLTSRDYLRFLSEYWNEPWRERWPSTRRWRRQVIRRAVSLYRSEHGRSPRLPAGLASSA